MMSLSLFCTASGFHHKRRRSRSQKAGFTAAFHDLDHFSTETERVTTSSKGIWEDCMTDDTEKMVESADIKKL